MLSIKSDVTSTVRQISELHFSGNVTPEAWYKNIKLPNGKVDLISITILADIIYWYRMSDVRDETTGQLVAYKKKFWSDKLQRSYSSIADKFGLTKQQATNSVHRLVALGLITREFRTINRYGNQINNILFLEPIVSKIKEISISPPPPPTLEVDRVPISTGGGGTLDVDTYTETTTQTSTSGVYNVDLSKLTKRKKLKADDPIFVEKVFEFWQKTMNHPNAKLDGHRSYYIKRALKDGWTIVDLNKAIQGCSRDPWNMGDNPHGKIYDSINLIFRDATHIERFIGYCDNPPIARPSGNRSVSERASSALAVAMSGNDKILEKWKKEEELKKSKVELTNRGIENGASIPSQIARIE